MTDYNKARLFQWTEVVIETTELPPLSKYLCLYLSTFMNAKQNMAFPGLKRIERETGLTQPTILKYLNIAEEKGVLSIERGNYKTSNKYHAALPDRVLNVIKKGVLKDVNQGVLKDVKEGTKSHNEGVLKDVKSNKQESNNPINNPKPSMSRKHDEARELLNFLNQQAGRNYHPTKNNLGFIVKRLEDYSVQELRTMVARKTRDWKNNPDMNKFLRPMTLFNASKCDQYVGECV